MCSHRDAGAFPEHGTQDSSQCPVLRAKRRHREDFVDPSVPEEIQLIKRGRPTETD